ncbi:hypothetical protein [Halomonas gemina]|uniref:hypothetical protein n=1 Tax=Halomonas gemina TaxID=2945105 RepID=UPI0020216BB4|nr:hypothetical protein [Halomonas gemina]
MIYGQRTEGMGDHAWLVECRCRHAAREMKAGRDKASRGAIFEQWQTITPGITRERVAEIWREKECRCHDGRLEER